jgi:hypothetical protein
MEVDSGRNDYGVFYEILRIPIYKRTKNTRNKVRCAKPTIRKKNTINILSKDGIAISLDIFDLNCLNMQNGHTFITGKVREQKDH